MGEGDVPRTNARWQRIWIPAFAGKTEESKALTQPSPTGRGLIGPRPSHPTVFPAKAGIQTLSHRRDVASRMNAFAGRRKKNKALTQPSPTGRGLRSEKPSPPWGRGLGEGDVPRTNRWCERIWVPAFAGNTDRGYKAAAICAAKPFSSAISAILPWPCPARATPS